MAVLFATERSVITKHLRNIFQSGELEAKSNVQKMHIPGSDKPVAFYDLDVAISVGYRVNSRRGTQFRIWATRVLRDHILKGYTVNARRLKELNQAVRLVADVARRRELTGDEATALLRVVGEYSYALDLLDDYDHRRVRPASLPKAEVVPVTPDEARRAVATLRAKYGASDLFGREKDDVKNHPFVDGNKRIAAALFLWFLEKNGALYRPDGGRRIEDGLLVAMTLLIAESRPGEKDILSRVLTHLLAGGERDHT